MTDPLSPEESRRYARHIVLRGLGAPGQQKLKAARVLIVGAGGLGSPAIAYLAAAGVGTLGVVDDDHVSISNLQRQVIHATAEVGRNKAENARDFAARLNPHVAMETFVERLTPDNARGIVETFHLVLDGSDTFATRLAVSDACFFAKRPLVSGAVAAFDGQVTTLLPHESGPDGTPNPTFRCLYPQTPEEDDLPACEVVGVVGALTGVIGTLMAMEAIKLIAGLGEPLVRRLLMYDSRAARFTEMRYSWRADNPLNGTAR